MNPSDDCRPIIKKCLPHQHGWLRRPELDKDSIQVWERPDGSLMAHDKKSGPLGLEHISWPKT